MTLMTMMMTTAVSRVSAAQPDAFWLPWEVEQETCAKVINNVISCPVMSPLVYIYCLDYKGRARWKLVKSAGSLLLLELLFTDGQLS